MFLDMFGETEIVPKGKPYRRKKCNKLCCNNNLTMVELNYDIFD